MFCKWTHVQRVTETLRKSKPTQFSSVQFSSVPWPIESSGGHEGRFSRGSLPVFFAGGPCEWLWQGQGCPVFDVIHPAFSSADHGVAHPLGCPEGGLWRGCRGVRHTRTMHVASFRLLTVSRRSCCEPQGNWFRFAPSRWFVHQVGDTEKFPHFLHSHGFTNLFPNTDCDFDHLNPRETSNLEHQRTE